MQGYDDSWASTQLWRSLGNFTSLRWRHSGTATENTPPTAGTPIAPIQPTLAKETAMTPWVSPIHNISDNQQRPRSLSSAHMYRHMASGVTSTGSHGENGSTGHGGSCYCDCPPFMGFGFCFAMKKKNAYLSSVSVSGGAQDCAAIDALAGAVCPAHGIPRQCHTPPQALDEDCSDIRYVHASSHVCGMWRMHAWAVHSLLARCQLSDGDTRTIYMTVALMIVRCLRLCCMPLCVWR